MNWRERIDTNLRDIWHHWSTKILAFLVAFPEGYNLVAMTGWYQNIPQAFAHVMSSVAAMGLLAKGYKQNPPKPKDQP